MMPATAGLATTFKPGEGSGSAWCAGYGGTNLGSYRTIYACAPQNKKAGKTPFDSYPGFQCTELANRYLFARTGRTLFDNEEGGNFVALAAATYSITDARSGSAGTLPAAGDIISMWGGRSKQKQNGGRTEVAVVTKVTATSSGWTITTLNQGDPSDADGRRGFNSITVSANGKTWSTEDGFYATFDWLKLAKPSGGSGTGSSGGGGSGGPSWKAAEAPLRSGDTGQLLAVACPAAASCTAVGAAGNSAMLVYRSGGSWRSASVPVPSSSGTKATLTAITCPSAADCLATGEYHSDDTQQGMLLSGHGASWTATRSPLPAGAAAHPHVILAGSACPTSSSCVAAGQYDGPAGSTYGLLVTGDGSSWTARRAPLPADAAAGPAARLTAIACRAGRCTAVGGYTDTAGNRQGMIVSGSGSSWTATRAALPASAVTPGAGLAAVSCPAATTCTAAGTFSAGQRGMILTGSGSAWTATAVPLPSGAAANPATTFHAVVCSSARACVAVGSYSATGDGRRGLVESGHGTSWTATSAVLPAGAAANQGTPGTSLVSAACAAGRCVAAGQYTDTAGDARLLLLSGQGSSWTAAKGPLPAGNRTVGSQAQGTLGPPLLASVSCPTATACVAAGTYPARKPGMEGLLETERG